MQQVAEPPLYTCKGSYSGYDLVNTTKEMTAAEEKYRDELLKCDEQAVHEYDKAVMTLSGGALGVSFTFLQFLGDDRAPRKTSWLIAAWALWGLSVSFVVISFYLSHRAMRKAARDLNEGKLNYSKPGGAFDTAINILNPTAGGLFLVGLICLLIFVSKNIPYERKHQKQSQPATTVTNGVSTRSGSAG